jgi:hypothetical protein
MRLSEGAKYLQFNRFEETAQSFFFGKWDEEASREISIEFDFFLLLELMNKSGKILNCDGLVSVSME